MEMSKREFKKLYENHVRLEIAYCCLCGKLIKKKDKYNIEHIQPRSRGGKDSIENWGVAHAACNSKKGALTLEEWRQWLALEKKRNGITK
jgi:5-methylcytosine-specific restriction endonuclease McrA